MYSERKLQSLTRVCHTDKRQMLADAVEVPTWIMETHSLQINDRPLLQETGDLQYLLFSSVKMSRNQFLNERQRGFTRFCMAIAMNTTRSCESHSQQRRVTGTQLSERINALVVNGESAARLSECSCFGMIKRQVVPVEETGLQRATWKPFEAARRHYYLEQ
jgi:hypothetical protein